VRALALAVACTAALLSGCAPPLPGGRDTADVNTTDVNTWGSDIGPHGEWPPDIPVQLRVREPRDSRGIAPCDLLTRAQLRELGLDPASAFPDARGMEQSCTWHTPDKSDNAGLGISTDPRASKLPSMYRVHHDEPWFQILEIAGHPALRFDPQPERDCGLSIAIADLQNLGVGATADRTPRPDPCAETRRMAEMILSNLPPLH
jgi:hypothetical protein